MRNHSEEIRVIIADLNNYLIKIDEYSRKPLAELDYYEIHRYNICEEEYDRLSSLMEQLCLSEREELGSKFTAISRTSQPFSSFHVAANRPEPINIAELARSVDWLKQEILRTIQYLEEPTGIRQNTIEASNPESKFSAIDLTDGEITILYQLSGESEISRTIPKIHEDTKDLTKYKSTSTTRDHVYQLIEYGLARNIPKRHGYKITKLGEDYIEFLENR